MTPSSKLMGDLSGDTRAIQVPTVRSAPQLLSALTAGVLFGFGLAFSTMIRPSVVLGFLRGTDLGLMLVLGGAVLVTFVGYRLVPTLLRNPIFGGAFGKHSAVMDRDTLLGAAIFGLGWGISGVCPGPAIAGLGAGSWELGYAVAGILLGALVQGISARRDS